MALRQWAFAYRDARELFRQDSIQWVFGQRFWFVPEGLPHNVGPSNGVWVRFRPFGPFSPFSPARAHRPFNSLCGKNSEFPFCAWCASSRLKLSVSHLRLFCDICGQTFGLRSLRYLMLKTLW